MRRSVFSLLSLRAFVVLGTKGSPSRGQTRPTIRPRCMCPLGHRSRPCPTSCSETRRYGDQTRRSSNQTGGLIQRFLQTSPPTPPFSFRSLPGLETSVPYSQMKTNADEIFFPVYRSKLRLERGNSVFSSPTPTL